MIQVTLPTSVDVLNLLDSSRKLNAFSHHEQQSERWTACVRARLGHGELNNFPFIVLGRRAVASAPA